MKMTVTRRIEAPRERVFELFADFPRSAERVSAIVRIEPLTPGPVAQGYRFKETRLMFKREAAETFEVHDFHAPDHYTLASESCGARYLFTFRFTEADSGKATDVTMEMDATPVTLLAKLMSPLAALMSGTMRKCVEGDMAELASLAEAHQPEATPATA